MSRLMVHYMKTHTHREMSTGYIELLYVPPVIRIHFCEQEWHVQLIQQFELFSFSEDGQVYTWGFGPLGKGPNVTHSKTPTPIPLTLFGQNELTPNAKVRTFLFPRSPDDQLAKLS